MTELGFLLLKIPVEYLTQQHGNQRYMGIILLVAPHGDALKMHPQLCPTAYAALAMAAVRRAGTRGSVLFPLPEKHHF